MQSSLTPFDLQASIVSPERTATDRPRIAVHKFTSCDGCQLAFLNLGETLLTLAQRVEIVHFAEAGAVAPDAQVDIAFIEGSISTPEEAERIHDIRRNSRYLIAIGACATSGGLQALRNMQDAGQWLEGIYAHPEYISTLATATPLAAHIQVDLELWGCPVSGAQVLEALQSLLLDVAPRPEHDKVCLACKRSAAVCVLVATGQPCMGPVTRNGCGALCPRFGRDCYACYGPADAPNGAALVNRFAGLGLQNDAIARRFAFINNAAPAFRDIAIRVEGQGGD